MFIHNKIHGLFEYIGIGTTIFDVVAPFDFSNKIKIANQTFFLLKEGTKYPPTSFIYHILCLSFCALCDFVSNLLYLIFMFCMFSKKNIIYILKYLFKAKFEPNTCLLKRKVPTNNINFNTKNE